MKIKIKTLITAPPNVFTPAFIERPIHTFVVMIEPVSAYKT